MELMLAALAALIAYLALAMLLIEWYEQALDWCLCTAYGLPGRRHNRAIRWFGRLLCRMPGGQISGPTHPH